jgi:alkylation response protein AidB-like acyl-CoA dehydrogenase
MGRHLAPVPYVEVLTSLRLLESAAIKMPVGLLDGGAVWVSEVASATASEVLSSAGAVADGILVLRGNRLSVFEIDGLHASRTRVDNLGRLPMGRVSFGDSGSVADLDLSEPALRSTLADRRLLCSALLIGAGQAALAQTVTHVRARHQFGRPIGSFQALQHRLADCSTQLSAAELLLRRGGSLDADDPDRAAIAARTFLAAGDAGELAAREAMQMFGGYGVCTEYDLHRFLRYVKSWRVLGSDSCLSDDALSATGASTRSSARFGYNPYAATYREQVATFADRHAPAEVLERIHASGTLHDSLVHSALAEAGWIGASWPTEHGGSGSGVTELSAMWEALNYYRIPVDVLELTEMVAYVIAAVGTPEQQHEILPKVRSGECLISLGYTEAEAGSDVAAARTLAVRDGDGWRISGAKMFTTGAHVADLVFLLARTLVDGPKHNSLTLFLVPLRAVGVRINAIHTFGGERTNATFFDDVWVPDSARVGDIDDGWSVLQLALAFERSMMGSYVGRAQRSYDDLLADLGDRVAEAPVRVVLASLAGRLEAGRAMADHVTCLIAGGRDYTVEAAMTKLVVTELFKDLTYRALDLVGVESLVAGGDSRLSTGGRLEEWFRGAQVTTIYGGSNEIQREIVSRQHLALPRQQLSPPRGSA